MISETTSIIILFVGVCVAMVYAYYIKRVIGNFVRALDGAGASDAESAKSLEELNVGKVGAFLIRKSLGKGAVLRRFIDTAQKPSEEIAGKDDEHEDIPDNIAGQKYFIIPKKHDEVLRRYKKDGTSIPVLILCIALLLVVAFVCTVVYPYFRAALEGITGNGDEVQSEESIGENAGEIPQHELPEGITDKSENEISGAEDGEIPEIIIDTDKKPVQNRFETVE